MACRSYTEHYPAIERNRSAAGAGLWVVASNDAADDKHELDVVMACASEVPTLEALATMRKKSWRPVGAVCTDQFMNEIGR